MCVLQTFIYIVRYYLSTFFELPPCFLNLFAVNKFFFFLFIVEGHFLVEKKVEFLLMRFYPTKKSKKIQGNLRFCKKIQQKVFERIFLCIYFSPFFSYLLFLSLECSLVYLRCVFCFLLVGHPIRIESFLVFYFEMCAS